MVKPFTANPKRACQRPPTTTRAGLEPAALCYVASAKTKFPLARSE